MNRLSEEAETKMFGPRMSFEEYSKNVIAEHKAKQERPVRFKCMVDQWERCVKALARSQSEFDGYTAMADELRAFITEHSDT